MGVTPGIDFGEAGEGWLRFCYAVSEETIDTALESLARLLPELEAESDEIRRRGNRESEESGVSK